MREVENVEYWEISGGLFLWFDVFIGQERSHFNVFVAAFWREIIGRDHGVSHGESGEISGHLSN